MGKQESVRIYFPMDVSLLSNGFSFVEEEEQLFVKVDGSAVNLVDDRKMTNSFHNFDITWINAEELSEHGVGIPTDTRAITELDYSQLSTIGQAVYEIGLNAKQFAAEFSIDPKRVSYSRQKQMIFVWPIVSRGTVNGE